MKHVHGLCLVFGWCIYPSVYICAVSQERNQRNSHDSLDKNVSLSPESDSSWRNYTYFLRQIFDKYGHDGVLTREGFEQLLKNLEIGGLHSHRHQKEGSDRTFTDWHERDHDHDHAGTNSDNRQTKTLQEFQNRTKYLNYSSPVAENKGQSEKTAQFKYQKSAMHTTNQSLVISKEKCMNSSEILMTVYSNPEQHTLISESDFLNLCPIIVNQLDQRVCDSTTARCLHGDHTLLGENTNENPGDTAPNQYVWFYSTLSVLVISATGMLSVAVIPVIQRFFYHHLLQFLVALAVGSLTGDALLHLLPHAMMTMTFHGEIHSHNQDVHDNHSHSHGVVWLGLMAVGGICLFFCAERFLNAFHVWKQNCSTKTQSQQIELSLKVGEKLSKHRYGSYGYSYTDAHVEILQGFTAEDCCDEKHHHNCFEKSMDNDAEFSASATTEKKLLESSEAQIPLSSEHQNGKSSKPLSCSCQRHEKNPACHDLDGSCPESARSKCVKHQINHHQHHHHHRHHHHGHNHQIPQTASATAWMVIAGDGLHNFSDGMAIGAAFATSLTGGLSTSIAVLCHELPHELGDFALLLKAGMRLRQALLYNCLSSLLCLFGMFVGIAVGNIQSANAWVFAGAAGMFIYIALVDMVPELSCETQGSVGVKFLIQVVGMSLGIAIMFFIAFYEDRLLNLIKD